MHSVRRGLLKVAPVERELRSQLYGLIDYVATFSDVRVRGREWQSEEQASLIQLEGDRMGMMKICHFVRQGYCDRAIGSSRCGWSRWRAEG